MQVGVRFTTGTRAAPLRGAATPQTKTWPAKRMNLVGAVVHDRLPWSAPGQRSTCATTQGGSLRTVLARRFHRLSSERLDVGGEVGKAKVEGGGDRHNGEERWRWHPAGFDLAQRLDRDASGGGDLDHAAPLAGLTQHGAELPAPLALLRRQHRSHHDRDNSTGITITQAVEHHAMIELKTPSQIDAMRAAGAVVADVLGVVRAEAAVGVRLTYLDQAAREVLAQAGATSPFLGYQPGFAPIPYPGVVCLSVNDAVLHGLPTRYRLLDGDMLSVDCGATLDGWTVAQPPRFA